LDVALQWHLRQVLLRSPAVQLLWRAATPSALTLAAIPSVRLRLESDLYLLLTCFPGDLKTYITGQGGAYASKVSDECTHLVANQKQFDAKGAKGEREALTLPLLLRDCKIRPYNVKSDIPNLAPVVNILSMSSPGSLSVPLSSLSRSILISAVKQALNNADIKIVSFDWLVKSLASKKKVDDSSYLLDAGNGVDVDGTTPKAVTTSKTKKRKRKEPSDDEDEQTGDSTGQPKQQVSVNGPPSKTASVNVPVDDWCSLSGSHRVYQGDDGTIYDVTLNQTNAGNNNNKFYRIQLLVGANGQDYRTWTRWGRVGEGGQNALLGSGTRNEALAQFDKKFKDKTGHKWDNRHELPKKGKYTYIERNYEESDNDVQDNLPGAGTRRSSKQSHDSNSGEVSDVVSRLSKPVQNLISFIFNTEMFNQTMASMDYDAHKMPLGKLSKRTLTQGYQILKDIAAIIGDPSLAQSLHGQSLAQALEDLSNRYFSTIPHAFGRDRPPVIQDDRLMKKEIELIESLTDMQLANDIMKTAKSDKEKKDIHLIDRQYEGLGMQEMTPLDSKSDEFKYLQDYLVNSAGKTHSIQYQVQDIFRIERHGEKDRFLKSSYASIKNSDRRLLWHGSRSTNYGGILSQGLRIAPPEAPV
jgi:poly [ADP-ribose] polymerase 2/3/4